jgi:NAD(P)H-dependent flavin oxidoreductase YrpB (nitropropane dioxygenase family)
MTGLSHPAEPRSVDITLPPSRLPEQLQVAFDEQVPVLSVRLGDPTPLVPAAHAAGARVMAMVTTVAEAVRNRFIEGYQQAGPEPLPWPLQGVAAEDFYTEAQARGEADWFPLLAGQGLRLLKRGQSAGEIVAELVAEAGAVFERLRGTTGQSGS